VTRQAGKRVSGVSEAAVATEFHKATQPPTHTHLAQHVLVEGAGEVGVHVLPVVQCLRYGGDADGTDRAGERGRSARYKRDWAGGENQKVS
jgi:hypothetical protein